MIRVTTSGVIADPADLARVRAEFDRQDWARLPQLLDPALLAGILDELDRTKWTEFIYDFYTEAQPDDGPAMRLLTFLTNTRAFLEMGAAITGCGPFTWFDGRVYRMVRSAGHHDDWHDDLEGGRRVALSLNLSRRPYEGGHLEIRRRDRDDPPIAVPNTTPGDAVVFRLSPLHTHRVGDVRGETPRAAFAGWFNDREPDLFSRLTQSRHTPVTSRAAGGSL